MLLCPKRRFSCFLCILPCAHFTVLFFCGNFGRFRDFFRSNVWRLQIRKNAKSVISLSTFFFQIRKSKKSGARTSAPRVVVGVVEEGGQMEDVVKNGKDICVFCEAKHTSEISIFFLWGKS